MKLTGLVSSPAIVRRAASDQRASRQGLWAGMTYPKIANGSTDREFQRVLNTARAKKLSDYILNGQDMRQSRSR